MDCKKKSMLESIIAEAKYKTKAHKILAKKERK